MNLRIARSIAGVLLLISTVTNSFSQSFAEQALFISRTSVGGTARLQAMGGAQIALGGDLSSAHSNPAGLGMYNRSEFSITPGYSTHSIQSAYLGNTETANKNNLMLSHLGIALHTASDGRKGLWGGTFAVTFSRVSNFNDTFNYSGTNPNNSVIDYFISDANGVGISQFNFNEAEYNTPTGLAYHNYLIGPKNILSPPGPSDEYFTDVTGIPDQSETVKNSGAQSQWDIAYGLNLSDRFFIGASLGIVKLSFESEKTYTERFTDVGQPMSEMVLRESLVLDGTGINGTLGFIFRPITRVQIGLTVTTPTGMSIDEAYSADMTSSWNNFEYQPGVFLNEEEAFTDNLTSSYSMGTPWKTSFGLAYFFGKNGFLSGDVEWINYGNTTYSSTDGFNWSEDNTIIEGLYKSTFNLRFGGEYRLNNFRLRAGYNFMPDPFETPENGVNREIISISGGVGYRTSKFYVDLAYIHGSGDNSYRPYQIGYPLDPLVLQTRKSNTVLITVGIPFGMQ